MKEDFAMLFSPDEARGQAASQFSASGFVANAAVETGMNDMQFRFTHGALGERRSIEPMAARLDPDRVGRTH
jgi:hypothetical protein